MLTIKRLSLSDAEILIEGAKRKADEIGVPMCIAVVDESGNLIAFERMDGGKAHSIQVAQNNQRSGRQPHIDLDALRIVARQPARRLPTKLL